MSDPSTPYTHSKRLKEIVMQVDVINAAIDSLERVVEFTTDTGQIHEGDTNYPCGRKPVPGSLETTQCVRHQLFDARAKVAIADRLAEAADALVREVATDRAILGDLRAAIAASRSVRDALAEYRKAVSGG